MSNFKKSIQWIIFVLLLIVFGLGGLIGMGIYQKEKAVAVTLAAEGTVQKGQVVSVHFSSPMLKKTVSENVKVSPELETETWWNGERELLIRPTEELRPDTTYQVKIEGARSKWLVLQKNIELQFVSQNSPTLLSVYPPNNQEGIDFFETVKMEFDQPIGDAYTLEVMINPLTGFEYVLDDTKTKISIIPKTKLEEQVQYKIKATIKHKQFPDFEKIAYEGVFSTRKTPEVTYTLNTDGTPIKTETRKEEVAPKITEGRYIDIDLSSQVLYIFENGREKGAYKVSTGKRGMNTPEGTFKVLLKAKRPWSKKYGLYMPWFIGFTNLGHGIHELPEWPSGYKEGANHLGTPVSHGCVRLGVGPAKIVYDFVEVGTPIVIHQ